MSMKQVYSFSKFLVFFWINIYLVVNNEESSVGYHLELKGKIAIVGGTLQNAVVCDVICHNESDLKPSDNDCQTELVLIPDAEVTPDTLSRMSRAAATTPCFLEVKNSTIPNAGRGVFAKHKIPHSFFFGPYAGEIVNSDDVDEYDKEDGGHYLYSWIIDEEEYIKINGLDENKSNWLRWVNSARFLEEQNLLVISNHENVYYLTIGDIEPGTELLVWYGGNYARGTLNIDTIKGSDYIWRNVFAPTRDIAVCPSCPLNNE